MNSKNWYWVVLVFAICIIYDVNCVPDRAEDNRTGRFLIISDLIEDIRDDDGQCF
jgi:hypothetical protein